MPGTGTTDPIPADDDLIDLVDDEGARSPGAEPRPWTVAVIDDDPAVHDGTRFALRNFRIDGRGVDLVFARSADEGRELLRRHDDIAVVLLDVVMETDTAGLDLVGFVRRELGNEVTRIILRTGQPGQMPERQIVIDYDINDYKAKTELTADKLFTSMTAALRSYEQLKRLTAMRRGLEIIVSAAADLHGARSIPALAEGVLSEIARLVGAEGDGVLVLCPSPSAPATVLAATGRFAGVASPGEIAVRDAALADRLSEALAIRAHSVAGGRSAFHIRPGAEGDAVALLLTPGVPDDAALSLVDVFCHHIGAAFDNAALNEALLAANAELEAKVAERTRELVAANERLSLQTERLRRANALKNELLGTVAHDLKNPLGVILGRAEIMEEKLSAPAPDVPRALEQIDHVRRSARHLQRMIDVRLADARSDATEMTLHRHSFDLSAVIEAVAGANRPHATRKGQTLRLALERPAMVEGDEDRVADAIDNLVSNAVKYSPPGGLVTVSLARQGSEAVVRVADSGPGIAREDVPRLFGQFQLLSAQPTGGESATGLGLYGAKRIVDLHGGRIGIEPPAGGGATFFIALPLAEDSRAP